MRLTHVESDVRFFFFGAALHCLISSNQTWSVTLQNGQGGRAALEQPEWSNARKPTAPREEQARPSFTRKSLLCFNPTLPPPKKPTTVKMCSCLLYSGRPFSIVHFCNRTTPLPPCNSFSKWKPYLLLLRAANNNTITLRTFGPPCPGCWGPLLRIHGRGRERWPRACFSVSGHRSRFSTSRPSEG